MAGGSVSVRGATSTLVEGQGSLLLKTFGTAAVQAGGALTLTGSSVGVNGTASCSSAARLGDPVNPATNKIAAGSGSVCIG